MRQLCTAFAAGTAILLLAGCAQKDEPAPVVETPEPIEPAPPAADNSMDAEQSGGDKVGEPEPAPTAE
jgi:hypothetical protein